MSGAEVSFNNQSTNATTYLWDFGDGNTSNEAMPMHTFEDGTYTVQLIASNACNTDTFTVELEIIAVATTSLSELNIQVAPNPVIDGQLYISLGQNEQRIDYKLMDILGRSQLNGTFVGSQATLDVQHLKSGAYMLMLEIDGSRATQQIIVH